MTASTTNSLNDYALVVREDHPAATQGAIHAVLGRDIRIDTEALESYCYSDANPLVIDLIVLAAAVEICDRGQRRSAHGWTRSFHVDVPVHDVEAWKRPDLVEHLTATLALLTGDQWKFAFRQRERAFEGRLQRMLPVPAGVVTVIPYSDGLDSRAVAALVESERPDELLRVRLGSKASDRHDYFARVPYRAHVPHRTREASGRSRAFKFASLAGIAALLSKATRIVMPESMQGALGPVLVPVGHAHEDYRNHPAFTLRMARFLESLFGRPFAFDFPRIWHTKGQTISAALAVTDASDLVATRSCWQQSRQASVDGVHRQCGICAACLLRRMSLHAAGIDESNSAYVWTDLRASTFRAGADTKLNPKLLTEKMRDYAIAGVLHLDHLSRLDDRSARSEDVEHAAFRLAKSMGTSQAETRENLMRAIAQHRTEWKTFLDSLGHQSFVHEWTSGS